MAGQGGFLYEGRIHQKLKSKNLVPSGFSPAGSNPNAPDCMFTHEGASYPLEVKLNLAADYGQGTLNYNDGSWVLGGAKTASADEMRTILNAVGTVNFVNTQWGLKGPPNKGVVANNEITQQMVTDDYRKFTEKFLSVPSAALHSYYAAKNTFYIQIGDYGMYYMGGNPAGLPIPQFTPVLRIRIRLKRFRSTPIHNYGFTTALQVTQKPARSSYNIDTNTDFLES